MFTEKQIDEINARAKTGADFPKRIQEMKSIGVKKYSYELGDGRDIYYGDNNFVLETKAKYEKLNISDISSKEKLRETILIHQQGKTDFPTFCIQSAEAGVERWISDLEKMQVIYFDKNNNEMITEPIPEKY